MVFDRPSSRVTAAHRAVGSVVLCGVILHITYVYLSCSEEALQVFDVWFCLGKRHAESMSCFVHRGPFSFFQKVNVIWINWEDLEFPAGTYLFSYWSVWWTPVKKSTSRGCRLELAASALGARCQTRVSGSLACGATAPAGPRDQGPWRSSISVPRGDFKSENCLPISPPPKFSCLNSSHFSSSSFENISFSQNRNSAFWLAFLRKGDALCAFNKQVSLFLLCRWRR